MHGTDKLKRTGWRALRPYACRRTRPGSRSDASSAWSSRHWPTVTSSSSNWRRPSSTRISSGPSAWPAITSPGTLRRRAAPRSAGNKTVRFTEFFLLFFFHQVFTRSYHLFPPLTPTFLSLFYSVVFDPNNWFHRVFHALKFFCCFFCPPYHERFGFRLLLLTSLPSETRFLVSVSLSLRISLMT